MARNKKSTSWQRFVVKSGQEQAQSVEVKTNIKEPKKRLTPKKNVGNMAQTLRSTQHDDTTTFELVLEDKILGEITCFLKKKIKDKGVFAEFLAHDKNTYRLLSAEIQRLTAALEAKNIVIHDVKITMA